MESQFEKLKELILQIKDLDEVKITKESNLMSHLSFESLDIIKLLVSIDNEFSVPLTEQMEEYDFEQLSNVKDLLEIIKSLQNIPVV